MKVLHLLNSDRFSGAENVVCQIISMMRDEENMDMLYCSPDGAIREALEERNIPYFPISSLSVPEVKRVIKAYAPDVIHAHDMRASFIAALSCGKIPLISHIHNNAFDSRGFSLKSVAYFFAAKKAGHIFWVSQSAFDGYRFHNSFRGKSSILYNVINIENLYARMHEDAVNYEYDVVYVGRLSYEKNPQRLIHVIEQCVKKYPDLKVAVIGTGELEEETMRLVQELHLSDNVSFLGFQSNPLKIMFYARAMLMTSRWEGTPMCALEAMALGVPIVSTPTDGLRELVIEGETGYLSEDDDTLAARVIEIVQDTSLRERLSCRSVEKAKADNNIKTYKNTLVSVYKKA